MSMQNNLAKSTKFKVILNGMPLGFSKVSNISATMEFETVVECDIDAYIPSTYIRNEYQKLDIYKRISGIENEEEHLDMQDELMDRFGDIPKPVENLLVVARLKAMAHRAYVTEVKVNRQEVRLTMYPNARLDTAGIPQLVQGYGGELKFQMGEVPCFHFVERKKSYKDCKAMLEKANELIGKMTDLVNEES